MEGQNHEQEHPEDVVEIISGQNAEPENNNLDPQTLENLADFLSHDDHELKQNTSGLPENEQPVDRERLAYKQNSPSAGDGRESRSRSRSREKSQKRWVYCCSKCKKNDKKGKTCVCVVPASQRRISIHKEGCSCCGCIGCSKEDVQMRQEQKARENFDRSDSLEKMRNGCCKECMKAFSSIKKACICQVPASVRRRKIPDNGCPICGCFGCNPEDTQKLSLHEEPIEKDMHNKYRKPDNHYHDRNRDRRNYSDSVSISRSRSVSRSPSRSRSPNGDSEVKYDNLDNSYIGNFLKNTFNLYLPLIGFGIPQRTYSYIHGKPPSR